MFPSVHTSLEPLLIWVPSKILSNHVLCVPGWFIWWFWINWNCHCMEPVKTKPYLNHSDVWWLCGSSRNSRRLFTGHTPSSYIWMIYLLLNHDDVPCVVLITIQGDELLLIIHVTQSAGIYLSACHSQHESDVHLFSFPCLTIDHIWTICVVRMSYPM